MLKDRVLLWKLKSGRGDALRSIYEAYKDELLALALTLSDDKSLAEDIVHDVFVSFAQIAPTLRLRSSIKSYLCAAVANRIRSLKRRSRHCQTVGQADLIMAGSSSTHDPVEMVVTSEQLKKAYKAIQMLPYEQKEVIIMRLQSGLKFRQIAHVLEISTCTVLSRYRYALIKLRSLLNSET